MTQTERMQRNSENANQGWVGSDPVIHLPFNQVFPTHLHVTKCMCDELIHHHLAKVKPRSSGRIACDIDGGAKKHIWTIDAVQDQSTQAHLVAFVACTNSSKEVATKRSRNPDRLPSHHI